MAHENVDSRLQHLWPNTLFPLNSDFKIPIFGDSENSGTFKNRSFTVCNPNNSHKYPSEEMKAKITEEIGLTEKQVSGWFCHRRLKDKRSVKEDGNNIGSQDRSSVVLQDRGSVLRHGSSGSTKQTDHWNQKPRKVESQRLYDDGEVNTSSERRSSLHKSLVSSRDVESSRYVAHNEHPQAMRNYWFSKPSEYLKVKEGIENIAITAVKRQLGRQYREDGRPLAVEFDPLPPGAF
ncbi:PREDICTED: uncharacterized protein LOC106314067 [Brassica oleracea var. oleracea]|uniref:uncharacterized protein LOC106314067 n=1 Tax=Brassica oleracea var. oleracea TaxID=109376 RepID=UPI0006A6E9D2|nr:PREDICTED: uncharacterized protein LOC106314067 [Brassica oleracea var. oleracea]